MKIPVTLLLQVLHAPGNLAKVLQAVAEMGLTIQALDAIRRTQALTTWELSVEIDPGEEDELTARIDALDIASVLGHSDRVFDRHRGGKIASRALMGLDDLKVLRDIYTPGVTRVCLAIHDNPVLASAYTARDHTVAIVTNGTAVLGLGDIGPTAGLPVMEGKAALFSEFAGISGVPLLLETKDADEIIRTVEAVAPSFGAIQLEDIAAPECFRIERELCSRLKIPVLHDDQHGTAVVVLAAILSAERLAGFSLGDSVVGQIGLGAAGLGIARLLLRHGVSDVLGADLSEGALASLEDAGGTRSDLNEIMQRADVVVATTGARGLITPEMVRPGQIIFALSNPDPEIEANDALDAGAKFAADGRNVNNVLAFPGLFKGAIKGKAKWFTDAMLLAAARAISDHADPDALVPSPLDRATHHAVARAVQDAVREGGDPISYTH